MGLLMSFMGKGLPSTQMLSFLTGKLYKQFIEKDITNFDEFHIAILDIFNTVNSALPGKHYDAPQNSEVEECFAQWEKAKASERKKIFMEFMKQNVNLNKLDNSTMITGLVTPPAAMVAKRAGETLPQLKVVKAIPDVVFVPSATILALISVKISRRFFRGSIES
ncbi:putative Calcium ion binding protein [Quillaja saponaria]|uniref:Calcium ion binding protein n=1 Tax=Quillaja saponaria TaxID=32244 RepID=A0AAD7LPN5_QUISA|nr:putative Calcium ion binding protein [Quillaja saponaria]